MRDEAEVQADLAALPRATHTDGEWNVVASRLVADVNALLTQARELTDENRRLGLCVEAFVSGREMQRARANRAEGEREVLRAALDKVKDWANTRHGGAATMTPAEVWPGLAAVLAEADVPTPKQCTGTLGSQPSWMSEGQYDPCRCKLPNGHDGEHQCEHGDPSLADAFSSSRNHDSADVKPTEEQS